MFLDKTDYWLLAFINTFAHNGVHKHEIYNNFSNSQLIEEKLWVLEYNSECAYVISEDITPENLGPNAAKRLKYYITAGGRKTLQDYIAEERIDNERKAKSESASIISAKLNMAILALSAIAAIATIYFGLKSN